MVLLAGSLPKPLPMMVTFLAIVVIAPALWVPAQMVMVPASGAAAMASDRFVNAQAPLPQTSQTHTPPAHVAGARHDVHVLPPVPHTSLLVPVLQVSPAQQPVHVEAQVGEDGEVQMPDPSSSSPLQHPRLLFGACPVWEHCFLCFFFPLCFLCLSASARGFWRWGWWCRRRSDALLQSASSQVNSTAANGEAMNACNVRRRERELIRSCDT